MIPLKGVDKQPEMTYTYSIGIESLSSETHPSIVTAGTLTIRSAVPMGWRLGQNVTLTIAEVPVKEESK